MKRKWRLGEIEALWVTIFTLFSILKHVNHQISISINVFKNFKNIKIYISKKNEKKNEIFLLKIYRSHDYVT